MSRSEGTRRAKSRNYVRTDLLALRYFWGTRTWRSEMLGNKDAMTTIAVRDLAVAKKF
jgi:hypothetical protein